MGNLPVTRTPEQELRHLRRTIEDLKSRIRYFEAIGGVDMPDILNRHQRLVSERNRYEVDALILTKQLDRAHEIIDAYAEAFSYVDIHDLPIAVQMAWNRIRNRLMDVIGGYYVRPTEPTQETL